MRVEVRSRRRNLYLLILGINHNKLVDNLLAVMILSNGKNQLRSLGVRIERSVPDLFIRLHGGRYIAGCRIQNIHPVSLPVCENDLPI